MDMLKRNLFWIICGLAAVGGLVLAGMGVKDARARGSMGGAAQLLSSVRGQSVKTAIKNRRAINDAQRRVDVVRSNYQEVIDWARRRNRRAPLVAGMFPKASRLQKGEFRDAYEAEITRLYGLLKGGEPPTRREEKDMADKIKNERPRGGVSAERGEEPAEKEYEDWGLITDYGARMIPSARAAIVKAMGFYCYVVSYGDSAALEVVDDIIDTAEPHNLEDEVLWSAQRMLWVQQDVVEALVGVNQRAAERLSAEGRNAWTGTLPVKDLISLRVSDYVNNEDPTGEAENRGPASPRGEEPAEPSLYPGDSFTGQYSTPEGMYDVLRFTVKLVVDVRELPVIIDAISHDRFYSATRVVYRAVNPNVGMSGKIYGEDPVVMAVIDFDACYFGDIYRRLMPNGVLERLGAERPGAGDEEGSAD